MPQITQNFYATPVNKGSKTIIKSRKLTLIYHHHQIHRPHSRSSNCPSISFIAKHSSQRSHVIFGFHISFSSSMEVLQSFLDFQGLTLLNVSGQSFCIVFQILVFLIFPKVQIQVIYFWQKYQGNNVVIFITSCQVVNQVNLSHNRIFTLTNLLRCFPASFSSEKLLSSICN